MPNATGLILLLHIASCVRLKRLRCVCTLIDSFVRSFIHSRSFWLQIPIVSISRWTSAALQARNSRIEHISKLVSDIQALHQLSFRPFDLILNHFDWHSESVHYTCRNLLSIVESPKPTLFCPSISRSTQFGADHLSTPQILVLTRVCQYAGGRPCLKCGLLVFACWLGGLNLSCGGGDLGSYSLPQHGIDLSSTSHNKLAAPEQRVFHGLTLRLSGTPEGWVLWLWVRYKAQYIL